MGQSEVFDPLLIEAAVLEALGGKREFPVRCRLDAGLSPTELGELTRCLCGLDERIEVVVGTGDGSLALEFEVSTLEWDPNPPAGLEAYPMRLNGRRAIC